MNNPFISLGLDYHELRLFFDGMLCMMALYAIFSFFQHRKAIYWQYALYIICMVVTFYFDDIDYGKADYLPGTNFKVTVIESLAFIMYIRFAILLIEIPKLDSFSHRLLKVLVAVLAIEMAADLLLFVSSASDALKSNIYIFFRCILAAGSLIVVPRILKVRQAAVSYFITGSLCFILGCLLALGSNFVPELFDRNIANPLSYPVTYMQLGVTFEVLCFTLGMSVLNRKNELEKISAQAQLIEQLQENEKKQSALQRIRDDISRDLHDELGADLGSISVMSHAAIRQVKLRENSALDTLNTIGETSRRVIARMREIVWSLHSTHNSVNHFGFRIKETAYALFEHQPAELHMQLTDEELDMHLSTDARRHLFLIFKEILHNAVRHAQARNIYIDLSTDEHELNLTIRDDGVGFLFNGIKNAGNGLINLRQRADSIHGSLDIESVPGEGTTVIIRCPISQPMHAASDVI